MRLKRAEQKTSVFHYFEENNIILGYTEIDSEAKDVGEYFGVEKITQLNQVHGNNIFLTSEVEGYPDGDGLILNEKNVMAVIRTADCVPLFFRTKNNKFAGVIHIGWQGLYTQIDLKLIRIIREKGTDTKDIFFFTGPSIEGKCYTVQHDLVEKFSDFSYSDVLFEKKHDGYSMDIIKGIKQSLTENGVPLDNISGSDICTFCNPRFPSYRRGDIEGRIFNFIMMR